MKELFHHRFSYRVIFYVPPRIWGVYVIDDDGIHLILIIGGTYSTWQDFRKQKENRYG